MATKEEIKAIKAGPWGWRYKFDPLTGVCLSVAKSLVERYPLSSSLNHNHIDAGKNGVVRTDSCPACQTEHRCGERWRAYLRRELEAK